MPRKKKKKKKAKRHRQTQNKCKLPNAKLPSLMTTTPSLAPIECEIDPQLLPQLHDKVVEFATAAKSEDQRYYASLDDDGKWSMLESMITAQFPNATVHDIAHNIYNIVKHCKSFCKPMMQDDISPRIAKLEKKYGNGALIVIFEYPDDICKQKLSNWTSLVAWWQMNDKNVILSPFLAWVSERVLKQYFQVNETQIETIHKYEGIDFKFGDHNVSIQIFVYNNPHFGNHRCYDVNIMLIDSFKSLTQTFFGTVESSDGNNTSNGKNVNNKDKFYDTDIDDEKSAYNIILNRSPSYVSIKHASPDLIKTIAQCSRSEREARRKIERLFLLAFESIDVDWDSMTKDESLLYRADAALNMIYPENICDFLPRKFDSGKRHCLKTILNIIHSDENKKTVANAIEKLENENKNKNDYFISISNDGIVSHTLKILRLPEITKYKFAFDSLFQNAGIDVCNVTYFASQKNRFFQKKADYFNHTRAIVKKLARKSTGNYCDVCGLPEKTMKKQQRKCLHKCSVCKQRWYCSKECQKKDWEIHKFICSYRNGLLKFSQHEINLTNFAKHYNQT